MIALRPPGSVVPPELIDWYVTLPVSDGRSLSANVAVALRLPLPAAADAAGDADADAPALLVICRPSFPVTGVASAVVFAASCTVPVASVDWADVPLAAGLLVPLAAA